MTTVSLEWHSQAVTNTVWFVRSDQRVVLVTAGKDGYVCIGTMMSDKIKFTHRICRYVYTVKFHKIVETINWHTYDTKLFDVYNFNFTLANIAWFTINKTKI